MSSGSIGYVNTARTLSAMSQQRATGRLILSGGEQEWRLYFFHGRLVYATGSFHRVRRWFRAVKRHCPDFTSPHIPIDEPWEYQLLSHGLTHQQLAINQAQGVIQASLEEVLFTWVSNPVLTSEWSNTQRFSLRDNSALSLLLSSPQVERVLQRSQELWKQWQHLELGAVSPYVSPVLKQPGDSAGAPPLPANLSPFLSGRHTLWDIASYARRPVTTVTQFLLPWVHQGRISLEEVADLPNPLRQQRAPRATQAALPLIACVDDSPTVGQVMKAILEPAGYRVLNIQDPLTGVATLSRHKPDLIFLDLIMPSTNGYNLCTFLRGTPIFRNTPIIILTSQDGLVDRARAKLAGATDFLSKPPDAQAVVTLVRHHLRTAASGTSVQPIADIQP